MQAALQHTRCEGCFAERHLDDDEGILMSTIGLILLILLIMLLIGAVPAWPYSRSWGYGPSGGLGVILVVVLILMLLNRI
jgi:hypothetical protein